MIVVGKMNKIVVVTDLRGLAIHKHYSRWEEL